MPVWVNPDRNATGLECLFGTWVSYWNSERAVVAVVIEVAEVAIKSCGNRVVRISDSYSDMCIIIFVIVVGVKSFRRLGMRASLFPSCRQLQEFGVTPL
jgi:hypothetical protein